MMSDIKEESTREIPEGELAPAPTQCTGPAWEGEPLSDRIVEGHAVAGCQESAEFSDKRATRLLPGAETSGDPTGSVGVLTGSLLESRGVYPSANNISTDLVNQSCLNPVQNAGDNGGVTTPLSGPPEIRCMDEVDDSTAAAQYAEEGTATPCGGLKHTDDHNIEQTINQDHATPGMDGFQELLLAAMRQSDAERAQDRESARNFRRFRQPSPLEQQEGIVHPPIVSTPAKTQPPTATSSSASDRGEVECIRGDSVCIANDVTVESADPSSASLALTPPSKPDAVKPGVVERQWVRYLSPEGYAYLYDEVTGESEWVVSGEEETQPQSPQTEDATSGAMNGDSENTGHVFGEQDRRKDLLVTACIETGERSAIAHPVEGESVGTCEASPWSQDTSDPDAR